MNKWWDKTLDQVFVDKKCTHRVDGAPSPHVSSWAKDKATVETLYYSTPSSRGQPLEPPLAERQRGGGGTEKGLLLADCCTGRPLEPLFKSEGFWKRGPKPPHPHPSSF